ncbi:immunoglobulin domain-containing protein, partial [Sinomicrobium weinanense]
MHPELEKKAVVVLCVLVILAFLCGFDSLRAQQAQERVYADTEDHGSSFLTGNVSDAGNAVDGNIGTKANLSVNIAGTAWIRMNFLDVPPTGKPVHIKFGNNMGLLNVASGVSIQAYRNGVVVGEEKGMGGLLSLLNGAFVNEIIFVPSDENGVPVAYDAVRITLTGLVSLGLNLDVYYAYYLQDFVNDIVCNSPVEVLYGSTSGLVGGLNTIEDPQNAIDGNVSTNSILRSNISVTDKTFIKTLYNTSSQPGDSVRVVFKNPGGGLLDASLLASSFTIRTYHNDMDNGVLALDENLLSLSLLPGSSDLQVLTYPVDVAFNRIEVSVGEGLLNALSSLHVYEMERIPTAPDLINDMVYTCFGEEATLQVDQPLINATYYWYTTATGGSPVFSGISYTPDFTVSGTHYFYVSETRPGCTD